MIWQTADRFQAFLAWARANYDQNLELTEEQKVTLFGPRGESRKRLMDRYLTSVIAVRFSSNGADRTSNRKWSACAINKKQVEADAEKLSSIIETLEHKNKGKAMAKRLEWAAKLTSKHGIDIEFAMNLPEYVASLISPETKQLLLERRATWSSETLQLTYQESTSDK